MTPYWLWIAGIFVAHCAAGLLLYRWRFIRPHPDIADADLLTFAGPFFAALVSYWLVFFVSPYVRPRSVYRQICLVVLAFCTAIASFWLYMAIALNTYGS